MRNKNKELATNISGSFLASILLTLFFYAIFAFMKWQWWPETPVIQEASKSLLRLTFIISFLYGISQDLSERFCK